ncbi:MAG TPA: DUF1990 domain-containing protein [Lacipirellulaceae bacterium]|jgi:uncharacterized protein (UPF0548 family)
MLSLRKPTDESIRRFLEGQAKLGFTYPAVGATANEPPTGYVVDHTRVELGEGEAVYRAACAAFQRWGQFRLGWVEAVPPETPIRVGANVAVVARVNGLWSMNASRIVYVVDEAGPMTRFGFAYGTLPDHVETGEERFLIEWDRADNRVRYDILAFSRPRHVLARLGNPMMRRMQKKFGRDSVAAMLRAVAT